MNFFQARQYRKAVHRLIQEARHTRNMRGDLLSQAQLDDLQCHVEELQRAWKTRSASAVDKAADELARCLGRLNPAPSHPKMREYVEIIAVALAVAMGFRTYFVQPFKIPTGSMQPTLYGITTGQQLAPGIMDRFPLNLIAWALWGERYVENRARVTGRIEPRVATDEEHVVFFIAGVPHSIRRDMTFFYGPGDYVERGQLVACGRVKLGDHIFVDKVRYNFSRPRRGDIAVFSTDGIRYPRIRPNSFYIKRLVALPGDEVSITPPYLVINGERVTQPYPFARLLNEREKGYHGYNLARGQSDAPVFLGQLDQVRKLEADEYLLMGDNTDHSYDGRYFGPVKRQYLVGPAFMIYWPFSRRWGPVR